VLVFDAAEGRELLAIEIFKGALIRKMPLPRDRTCVCARARAPRLF
jgi:hypothetical protein